MSRIALLRNEIQNECEKNKNLQFILQNFENVRDDILDQIDILYDPYSLFTSDSEYSSSEDDILNKSSDSDDAEFFVSQKAKKLAKSASRIKLLSQSSTDLNKQDSNSIQSPVKKPSSNQSLSHSNDNLKKAISSPNKSSTNQQNQTPLIKNKQSQDVPKIQNLSVRPYGDLKKNVLTQRVIIYDPNKDQQYSSNKTTNQSQSVMQTFQTFLQNIALMKQSQKNQIQQIPNQKTNQVLLQYHQQQNQKQKNIVPQISIQQNASKQIQNTINSSEQFKIQPPANNYPSSNQQSIQNTFQQQINESNKSKTQLFSPKTPQTSEMQNTTTTSILPMPQFKQPEIKKKQTKTSIQQQENLNSINLANFIMINAQQLHDTIIQSAVQVYRQKTSSVKGK